MKSLAKNVTTVKVFLLFLFAFGCVTIVLVGFAIGRATNPASHESHAVSVLTSASRHTPLLRSKSIRSP
ncbi:MAG: hypothetical protein ACRER1_01030 [Gammaproteobacteria bacterium]